MGTRQTLKKKHEWIQNAFNAAKERNDGILSLDCLLANFCIDNCTDLRTAKELVKIYETAGKIEIQGSVIYVL